MKRAKTSVKASHYQEISKYWDTHDLEEIWEQTKPVDVELAIESSWQPYRDAKAPA
jgi:hypothetical protein